MATYEFRSPKSEAEVDGISNILAEAFAAPMDALQDRIKDLGKENVCALFDGPKPVGGLWLIHKGQWFGGNAVPMAGVGAVGIATEARGHGAAHALMSSTVNMLHDEGVALSALFPASRRLYQKSGYDLAGTRFQIEAQTRDLRHKADRTLTVRNVTQDDQAQLHATYTRMARNFNGLLDRHEFHWSRVFEFKGEPARGYGIFRGDELVAYTFMVHRSAGLAGYNLFLTDLVYTDRPSAERLIRLLADHSSLGREVMWFGSPTDPLLSLLPENHYKVTLHFEWMIRLTHVQKALELRGYPKALSLSLDLEVDDDIIEGNKGRVRLEIEGGKAKVSPGGSGDLRIHVRQLASLYSGFRSPKELAMMGLIEGDETSMEAARAAFAGSPPFLGDMF